MSMYVELLIIHTNEFSPASGSVCFHNATLEHMDGASTKRKSKHQSRHNRNMFASHMYWYIDWQKSFIHLCVPLASYKSHWVREIRNEWYALGQAFSCLIGHKSQLCLQIKCEYVCLFVPLTSVFALEFTFNWPRKACSIKTWVGASAHNHCVCACECVYVELEIPWMRAHCFWELCVAFYSINRDT